MKTIDRKDDGYSYNHDDYDEALDNEGTIKAGGLEFYPSRV
jgi:hypothetical protein